MGLEFRRRDYRAEEQSHSLRRTRADAHPLSSAHSPSPLQVNESESGRDEFCDPLRANDGAAEVSSACDIHREDVSSEATVPADLNSPLRTRKEWISLKKMLMQRFPVSKTSPASVASGALVKGNEGELDDDTKFDDEDVKIMSQQECMSKLQGLKSEINQSWCADDRVKSLRLSIKVVRFIMDSSVIQFYPTLFVLATDIMDMLGDLVWNRIKQKAEITEENFKADDIRFDAKETCNNWFCKIGSVRELLPRIQGEAWILCYNTCFDT